MDVHSSTSSSRWPWAAILAIAIILIAEGAISNWRALFLDDVFPIQTEKLEKLTGGEGADVLILGDSRSFSIKPGLVAKALGKDLTAENLTWPFYGVDGYLYTLDSYLAYHDNPKYIVTSFMPNHIAIPTEYLTLGELDVVRDRAFASLPAWPMIPLLIEDGRWGMVWQRIEFEVAPPSTTYRRGINHVLASYRKGEGWPERPDRQARWISEYDTHGAFTIFETEVNPPNAVEFYTKNYTPLELFNDPAVVSRFEDFLKRAEEKGIVVVLMNTPLPEVVVEHYEKTGVTPVYLDHIRRFEETYQNLYVIEPLIDPFPNDYLGDLGHLNQRGDREYEKIYPERLKEHAPDIKLLWEEINQTI